MDIKKTQKEVETLFNLQQEIDADEALRLAQDKSNLTAKKPSKKDIRKLNKLRDRALKDT